MEATEFVEQLPPVDVAYFDPPYNQHPYGSNYFMLNLILKNERPEDFSRVSGIPKNWKRSEYNMPHKVMNAFREVLEKCPAKIMLISYNSEGFITCDDMVSMLEKIGSVATFDQGYNTFRGCRNLSGRAKHVTEFLFMVEKKRLPQITILKLP